MKRLMILNGPNLNLLGVREPHIYGTTTLAQIKENCEQHAAHLGLALSFHQSNHEGELVDWIQSARQTADAIIINPAGYSFTSIAILDAIKAFEGPVLEVHISNIHARDEHHRHSKISSVATGVICGLALRLYRRDAGAGGDDEAILIGSTASRTASRRTAPFASRVASANIAAGLPPVRRVRRRRASPSAGRRACRGRARPCRPCPMRRSPLLVSPR